MIRYERVQSQSAVYDWLKKNGPATAAQVGEALHATVSECPEWSEIPSDIPGMMERRRHRIRREWARKLLVRLRDKGRVRSYKIKSAGRIVRLWAAIEVEREGQPDDLE